MADNVTTDELEQALQDLASEMGLSVKEYVESLGYATVAELQASTAGLQEQITAITELDADNGATSLAEKIAEIESVLSDENGVVQQIFQKILENKQLVLDETSRATAAEADLQSQVTAAANKASSNETAIGNLSTVVSDNKTAQEVVNADIEERVSGAETTISTLTGDETVDGSVKKQIADEATRTNVAIVTAKDEAVDTAKSYTDAQIEAIAGDTATTVSEVADRVSTVENTLNDTTDADGNLLKGVVSKVADNAAAIAQEVADRTAALEQTVTELKAYSDSKDLKASSMNICGIHNKFRASLGLADKDCSGSSNAGDGAVI